MVKASKVCKLWNEASKYDPLWKYLIHSHHPHYPPAIADVSNKFGTYFELFQLSTSLPPLSSLFFLFLSSLSSSPLFLSSLSPLSLLSTPPPLFSSFFVAHIISLSHSPYKSRYVETVCKRPYVGLQRCISSSAVTKTFIEIVCKQQENIYNAPPPNHELAVGVISELLCNLATIMEDCQRLVDHFLQQQDADVQGTLLDPISSKANSVSSLVLLFMSGSLRLSTLKRLVLIHLCAFSKQNGLPSMPWYPLLCVCVCVCVCVFVCVRERCGVIPTISQGAMVYNQVAPKLQQVWHTRQ